MGRSYLLVGVVLTVVLSGCQASPVPFVEPTSRAPHSLPAPEPDVRWSQDTTPAVPSRSSVEPFARGVLTQYLAATDLITSRGGMDPEEIAKMVTPDWLAEEHRGFAEFQRQGIRTLGTTTSNQLLVQSVQYRADGDLEVAVFSCIDTRSVWVVPDDAPEPPENLEQWLDDGSPALAEQDFPESWQDYIETVAPRPGAIAPVLLWFRGPDEKALQLDFTDTWRGHHPCIEE